MLKWWWTFGFLIVSIKCNDKTNCQVENDLSVCQCSPPNHPSPTEIECVDIKFKSEEILYLITNSHFTNLRSITFRGNHFPYLYPYVFGGFGNPNVLGTFERIDLSSNSVENISKDAFCGMKGVQKLDLSFNQVVLSEEESTIFEPMKSMIELKMKRFFAQPIQSDVQLVHLQRIFQTTQFTYLHMLDLSSNSLDYIPPKFLCFVKDLRNLYLSNNLLTTLDLDVQCMSNLRVLDLSHNRFIDLDPYFMQTMSGLRNQYALKLSENPFECNCNSTAYLEWIRRSFLIMDKDNLTCYKASPRLFAGKTIYPDVVHSIHKLDCNPPVGGGSRVRFYYCILAVLVYFVSAVV